MAVPLRSRTNHTRTGAGTMARGTNRTRGQHCRARFGSQTGDRHHGRCGDPCGGSGHVPCTVRAWVRVLSVPTGGDALVLQTITDLPDASVAPRPVSEPALGREARVPESSSARSRDRGRVRRSEATVGQAVRIRSGGLHRREGAVRSPDPRACRTGPRVCLTRRLNAPAPKRPATRESVVAGRSNAESLGDSGVRR